MKKLILNIFTSPKLERLRAVIPYPVFAGTVAFFVMLPVSLGVTLGEKRDAAGDTFSESPFFIATSFAGVSLGILSLLSLTGFISGYRPFRKKWDHLSSEGVGQLIELIADRSRKSGCSIYWQDDSKGLVGVFGADRLLSEPIHSAENGPIRMYCCVSGIQSLRATLKLKLETRTVVFWDSGEAKRIKELGESITAGLESQIS